MAPMSDREFSWVEKIDTRIDALEKTAEVTLTKMELMTNAFNRLTVLLIGSITTVIATAVLVILFGRPAP